jgi:hypothetical protein
VGESAVRARRNHHARAPQLPKNFADAESDDCRSIENFAAEHNDEEFLKAAENLIEIFKDDREIPLLTNHELIILQRIFESLPTSPLVSVKPPAEESFLSGEELRFQVNDWLDNLPSEPVLLKF